jgi:hypothetical protein
VPSFRCPKCKTRLTADDSRPTVNCTACGQLCAIPRQAVPSNPVPAPRPVLNPGGNDRVRGPAPPPLKMDDVVDLPDEVLDVSEALDDGAVDVVAADDHRDHRSDCDDGGPQSKRRSKSRKKGSKYKRPIWDSDDRGGSWLLSPPSIATAIMLLVGFVFTFLAFTGPVAASKVLFAYGVVMQIVAIVWGMCLAGADGEGARAFFWVHRWVYLVNNLDRGLFPMVTEVAGMFFMVLGWAV